MISQRIKELRLENHLTQKELSDYLGLTPKMISFYELGQRVPPSDIILKLAEKFHVTTDYLLGVQPHQKDSFPVLTPKESSHLQKYRALDDDGRALVDGLLDTLHEQRSSKFNTSSDETTAS